MKCLVHETSYLWNAMSVKFVYEMSCLWNVIFMKRHVYKTSCIWNVLAIKCPSLNCPSKHPINQVWHLPFKLIQPQGYCTIKSLNNFFLNAPYHLIDWPNWPQIWSLVITILISNNLRYRASHIILDYLQVLTPK